MRRTGSLNIARARRRLCWGCCCQWLRMCLRWLCERGMDDHRLYGVGLLRPKVSARWKLGGNGGYRAERIS